METRPRLAEDHATRITREIIGAAIEVHRTLGSGLLESAYDAALTHELVLRGMSIERQVRVPLVYKGIALDATAYVCDLIVERGVLVELKAVEHNHPAHKRQVLTYLRLTGCRYGLLINFGAERLVDGFTRLVDGPGET